MKFSYLLIPVFLLVATQFTLSNIKILSRPIEGDFKCFYRGGHLTIKGDNPYLQCEDGQIRNPPSIFLVFSLLAIFPSNISQILFFIFSLMLFWTPSVLIINFAHHNLVDTSVNPKKWLLLITYLSLVTVFFPFRHSLSSGHINTVIFSLLALSYYLLYIRKSVLSAIPLSLAITFSITPIFLLVMLFLQKNYRILLNVIISLVLIFLVTASIFGIELFKNYLAIPSSYFDFGVASYYNQSFPGLLAKITNEQQIRKVIYFPVLLLALILFISIAIKVHKDKIIDNTLLWNISILYILIFAPFTWQYHYIIAIFPLITSVWIIYTQKLNKKYLLAVGLAYLLMGLNIKNPTTFLELKVVGVIITSHSLWGAILLLILNFQLLKQVRKPPNLPIH